MDVSLTAKLKNFSEFYSLYRDGDERKLYQGKSLLFHAISNNDPDSRYEISIFCSKKVLTPGRQTPPMKRCYTFCSPEYTIIWRKQ